MKTIYNQIKDKLNKKILAVAYAKTLDANIISEIAMDKLDYMVALYRNEYHVNLKTMRSEEVLLEWTGQDIENIIDGVIGLTEFTLIHADIYADIKVNSLLSIIIERKTKKERGILVNCLINNKSIDVLVAILDCQEKINWSAMLLNDTIKLRYHPDRIKFNEDSVDYPFYIFCAESRKQSFSHMASLNSTSPPLIYIESSA